MAQPVIVPASQSGAEKRHGDFVVVTGDTVHQQIVDMEVALEICNNYVAIANSEQDKLEQAAADGADVGADIEKMAALRMTFLHEMRSNITRENMEWVRRFNDVYGAALKNFYKHGVLPDVFTKA